MCRSTAAAVQVAEFVDAMGFYHAIDFWGNEKVAGMSKTVSGTFVSFMAYSEYRGSSASKPQLTESFVFRP
ncbi:MAG: hypothetical protein WAO83_20510 [Fuerstiella sp.]